MAKDNTMDALFMAMLMSKLREKDELVVSPFEIKIEVSPISISCHTSGNRKMIEDLGAEEWLKETQEKIEPIMKEQTTKFAELFSKKFDIETIPATHEAREFSEFLDGLFGNKGVGE